MARDRCQFSLSFHKHSATSLRSDLVSGCREMACNFLVDGMDMLFLVLDFSPRTRHFNQALRQPGFECSLKKAITGSDHMLSIDFLGTLYGMTRDATIKASLTFTFTWSKSHHNLPRPRWDVRFLALKTTKIYIELTRVHICILIRALL